MTDPDKPEFDAHERAHMYDPILVMLGILAGPVVGSSAVLVIWAVASWR